MAKTICKYLSDEIQFVDNRIVPCGSRLWDGFNDNAEKYFIKPDKNLKNVDFDLYFERRNKYIKMYENGEEPEFCKGCFIYAPSDEYIGDIESRVKSPEYKFKRIHINHKTICSCRCIYCCLADNGDLERFKIMNQQQTYNIMPILEQIEKKNLIDENTQLCIFGGECTEYPEELSQIIDFGLKHNCGFIALSNGIIYSEKIEELLKKGKVELRFSLDSGTKKTYQKVKRVKAYDRVMANIERYSNVAKTNPHAGILLKYIICPGVNDSIKEVQSFLKTADKFGINKAILSINRFWLIKNSKNRVPNAIRQVILYWYKNKDFPNIGRAIDSDELWPWWVDKILSEKSVLDIFSRRYLK